MPVSSLLKKIPGAFRGSVWPRRGAVVTAAGCLLLLVSATAHAQSAAKWNKRGQDAEAREDYDSAFNDYLQAHLKKPADLRYLERYQRMRFQAAAMHVDRGRVLRQSGDLGGALTEFSRALVIDPGDQAASQELAITNQKTGEAGGSATPTGSGTSPQSDDSAVQPGVQEQMARQEQMEADIDSIAAPIQLVSVSNDPISLHMVEDTKVIYQAIGKAAGLNVLFDPDYQAKRIPVDLTNVSLQDALRIVGILSGTFWKPVTPNTILVAQNNRSKHTDLDDMAVQTFYLTNVSQQNDANEVLVALRNVLDPQDKLYLIASQNAIVLRAPPDQMILAEKLINDLDRTRPEVVVDVAVLEVSRDKIRNLGITLPTSFGLTPQQSNYNQSTNSTTSTTTLNGTTTGTGTGTTTSGLTLNTLGNINATNFAVSISGGTVNALLSDSDTRVLQNPRIRATDGQRATLKIGSKIPVATGSSTSTITTTALATTQFTYLDVGVNIDMTPTVHYDREISLKMKIEVSSQNGSVTISGVTEPIISQRVIEQVIQLKEGEPSILAGILQKQDTRSVNGTPGLGEIPLLKYFFSTQGKEQQEDEIVFLLIPHIVRESVLTEQNTRPIYTGTQNSYELIRNLTPQAPRAIAPVLAPAGMNVHPKVSAANAAQSMVGALASAGERSQADAGSQFTGNTFTGNPVTGNNPTTGALTIAVSPALATQAVGSTFQVAVTAANARDLSSVPLQVGFNPRVLQLVNVDAGEVLARGGQAVALVHRDEGNGQVTISASRPPGVPGVEGNGTVVTLTFKAIAAGDSPISLLKVGAKDSRQVNLPTLGRQGVVHVQ
jgi:general secretion pathway protein D